VENTSSAPTLVEWREASCARVTPCGRAGHIPLILVILLDEVMRGGN